MATPALQDMQVGDSIPALQLPAISRTTLALYAGASGDHNPIHIDIDFARSAGLDDVFAHGMLSAAYVGRPVTHWAPPHPPPPRPTPTSTSPAAPASTTCLRTACSRPPMSGGWSRTGPGSSGCAACICALPAL